MRRFVLLAVVCVGCGRNGEPLAEKPSEKARPKEEVAVEAWVLDKADDPKSVTFDRWGPHRLDKEPKVVRLIMREKNKLGSLIREDGLFFITDGKVTEALPNPWGDDWLEKAKGFSKTKDFKGSIPKVIIKPS